MFWRAYKNERSEDFTDAISELIANNRAAPLFKEISEATERIKTGRNHRNRSAYATSVYGSGSPFDVLREAAKLGNSEKHADRQYVDECLKLLKDKLAGKINPVQFEEGCQYLEEVAGIIKNP